MQRQPYLLAIKELVNMKKQIASSIKMIALFLIYYLWFFCTFDSMLSLRIDRALKVYQLSMEEKRHRVPAPPIPELPSTVRKYFFNYFNFCLFYPLLLGHLCLLMFT